jgi:tetratricopeptide (TPR) repeat protein
MGSDVSLNRIANLPPKLAWGARFCLVFLLMTAFLSGWVFEAEARSSRRASRSSSKSVRSARSSRSARSQGGKRTARSVRSSSRSGRRTRAVRASAPAHHGPTASQIRRQETSGSNDLEKRTDLERSYRAYDQGLSEWLAGNYSQAAKYLHDAYELYSDFHGSRDVLDSIYLYDLGQAAEAAGDLSLAKNSYQRSLRRRPDFADCCIRLTGILTRSGESALALVYARRLAEKNPQDPRAQFLLANMLERAGFAEEGKTAKENFRLLMKGGTINSPQSQPRQGESDSAQGAESPLDTAEKKAEPEEKVETDIESGVVKKEVSGEKINDAKDEASEKR